MKVYSKILALLSATSVLSYSLEGKVKREIEDQCTLGIAQFNDCFARQNGESLDQLCSNYNSKRCQNYIIDPIAAVPACQSLSKEQQQNVMNYLLNEFILDAGIVSIECGKDENNAYCSDVDTENITAKEKLLKAVNDSSKSSSCTKNAIDNLNYMLSDIEGVNIANEEVVTIAKKGLEILKSDSNAAEADDAQCHAELAKIDGCFQGENLDQLCSNYSTEICQKAIEDPMKVFASCQSLSDEKKDAFKSELFNRVIFPAGVAAIQCAKNEDNAYCSEVTEGTDIEKFKQVINDAAASKQCTKNAIWVLDFIVSDNNNVSPSNEEMVEIAKNGLEILKSDSNAAEADASQCYAELAEIDACFQGENLDQLCSNYNTEICQKAIVTPMAVAPSCNSLSEEQQNALKSELFNRVIFKAGLASIQCAKNENDEYCSESTDFMTAVKDSCNSQKCTESAIKNLNFMVSDNSNVNESNGELASLAKNALELLNSENCPVKLYAKIPEDVDDDSSDDEIVIIENDGDVEVLEDSQSDSDNEN